MIYDDIEQAISGILTTEYSLSGVQILTENEVPTEDIDFFCREVWTYGTMDQFTNLDSRDFAILNLEVYQRKNNPTNKIIDFIRNIRFYLSKHLSVFHTTSNGSAKLNGISLTKNLNEENWSAYTIGVQFYIYKEN